MTRRMSTLFISDCLHAQAGVSDVYLLCGLQEYQAALAALQDFPWTVATGDDEKHLQALGKLPAKKKTAGETFINWWVSSEKAIVPLAYACLQVS